MRIEINYTETKENKIEYTRGVKTLYTTGEVTNGLVMGYSASGRYTQLNGDNIWTEDMGGNAWEESSSLWCELKKLNSTETSISSNGEKLYLESNYEIQNYLVVPLIVGGQVVYTRTKIGSPEVTSTSTF